MISRILTRTVEEKSTSEVTDTHRKSNGTSKTPPMESVHWVYSTLL